MCCRGVIKLDRVSVEKETEWREVGRLDRALVFTAENSMVDMKAVEASNVRIYVKDNSGEWVRKK